MLEKENFERISVEGDTPQTLQGILDHVEEAVREGNPILAYERSLRATQVAPQDANAWFLRASLAPTLEERILCVNRLNELDPGHQDRHHIAFYTLKELLEINPCLAYLEESQDLYRVLRPDRQVLSIPKKRSDAGPPLYEIKDQLAAAKRWLTLAIVGLLSAGLLTLIFAPLAAWSAIFSGRSVNSRPVKVGSAILFLSSLALFIVGLFFSLLFAMHWVG